MYQNALGAVHKRRQ